MTRLELKKELGVSDRTITMWIGSGLPYTQVGPAGKRGDRGKEFDLEAVKKWIAENDKHGGSGGSKELKDKLLKVNIALKELELEKEKALLIPKKQVDEILTTCFTYVRNKLSGLPTQLSPHLVGLSTPEIEKRLTEEINKVLTDMSRGMTVDEGR